MTALLDDYAGRSDRTARRVWRVATSCPGGARTESESRRSEGANSTRRHTRRRGSRAAAMIAATAVAAGLMSGIGTSPASADPIIDSKSLLANPVSEDGSKIVKAEVKDSRSRDCTCTPRPWTGPSSSTCSAPPTRAVPASDPVPAQRCRWRRGFGVVGGETDALELPRRQERQRHPPIGGACTYYTDWVNDDPVLGRNKWKTFLTEELPPLIDGALGTNGGTRSRACRCRARRCSLCRSPSPACTRWPRPTAVARRPRTRRSGVRQAHGRDLGWRPTMSVGPLRRPHRDPAAGRQRHRAARS